MLDCPLSPRGYRLLARVSRLPGLVAERLAEHLGGLQRLLATSLGDLQSVDVGDARARSVRASPDCPGSPSRRFSNGTCNAVCRRATGPTFTGL